MATKTFEELRKLAIQIRDEKANKQNTALRIGNFLLSSLDKMESMDIADIAEAVLQAETAADEAKRQADIVAQSGDIVEEAIKQGAAAAAAAAAANAAADKATNEGLFKTQQDLSEEEQGQVKQNLGIEDLMASLETQTIEGFSETVNATTSTKSVDNIIPPSIDFAIVDLGSTDGRELPTTPSMSVVLAKVTDDGRVKMQGYLKTSHEEYNIQVVSGSAEKYALNVNIITDIETTYKVFQIRYLSSFDGGKFKGSYGELSQLQAAYPTAGNGSYAFVGNPRHLYEWVTNAWTDRGEFITNVDQAIDAQSERAISNKAVSAKLTELEHGTVNSVFTNNTVLNGVVKELYIIDPDYSEEAQYEFKYFRRYYTGNQQWTIWIYKNGSMLFRWDDTKSPENNTLFDYIYQNVRVLAVLNWGKMENGKEIADVPINAIAFKMGNSPFISSYLENYEYRNKISAIRRLYNHIELSKQSTVQTEVNFEILEDRASLSWEENSEINNDFVFLTLKTDTLLKFYRKSQYNFVIKNTGDSLLELACGLTKGSRDWAKGFFVSSKFQIAPGETKNICFSYKDWTEEKTELVDGDSTYMLVVINGNLGITAIKTAGSIEIQEFYSVVTLDAEHATSADNAKHATNADNAEHATDADNAINTDNSSNAGWLIGGLADNAVFRDSYPNPTGCIQNAMTVEKIDKRTIKLITNITEDQVGSVYRGVYWKITFKKFEDIKGLWKLSCTYNRYFETRVNSKIQDWGPTVKDTFSLDYPKNGGAIWDLYDLITKFKEEQEALGEESKWTGDIISNGYFYIQITQYLSSGILPVIEDTMTLDHIPENSKVIATDFSESAKQEIKEIAGSPVLLIEVTNWGDSLTAGAGSTDHKNQETVLNKIKDKGYSISLTATSKITYSIMMQELLGEKYKVNNCGVGGENINTIAARLGANLAYANNDFVLPQDTSPVQIGDNSSKLKSSWGGIMAPLLQGDGNSVNPCYVEGIECTLKWTGSSYNDPQGTYTLQRVSLGERAVNLTSKTPIIMSGSKLYRNTKLAVLWCWQNGGYNDDSDLIDKLDKMVTHLSTSNYVIVGLHSGTASSREAQESALSKKFGDKFFNWRDYVSTNALYDFGLVPTEEDVTAMQSGSCPPSLLVDSVHLGAAGYAILGFKIVERFKNLGYL